MAKPAAPPPPPPAPPAAAPRSALAPTLVEMPANTPDPTKELAARQKAGLERIAAARRTAEGEDREGPPPPPKESKSPSATTKEADSGKSGKENPAAASPSTSATAPPKKDDSSTDASGKETAPKELRYDLKSLGRWAEKHPEEAKEFGEKILKVKVDEEWIKLSNKKRRLREDVQERSAAGIAAAEEKLAQALREKAVVDGAVEKLTPVADLWEATGGRVAGGQHIDFDAGDAAFEANAGIKIDDYMRLRARRGIINPEMARMKAENARLKREAEAKAKPTEPEKNTQKAAAEDGAPDPAAAVVTKHKAPDWSEDIEKKHPLRKFDGWKADLAEAMAKHYDEDLDEYDADVEDVADKLAKRKMRELQGEEEQEEKPKAKKRVAPAAAEVARPKPKRAPADAPQFSASDITGEADDDDDPVLLSGNGLDWQKRVKRAHERALRAVQERGE